MKIGKLTRRLADEMSVREMSVAEKKQTQDAVAVKEKLTRKDKQVSICVTEQEGKVMNNKKTVAL